MPIVDDQVTYKVHHGYRLQQWWAKAVFLSGPETGEVEWRDVPIVREV